MDGAENDFVPTVDISDFIRDPNSQLTNATVERVPQACIKTGFFQVTGHGVPHDVLSGLFEASKKFFALPMEEKAKLDARKRVGRRGYDVLESQTYHTGTLGDLKEGFYIGHNLSPRDPTVQARRFFMGPNVWPDPALLAPGDFKKPVERYFAAVNALALKLLDLIARTLPYGPDVFSTFSTGYVVAPLRLLHYPPARPTAKDGVQLGAGAHTDFGAITLLLQDENPGLEVLDTERNVFVPIEPSPAAFVVNVGDMLSAWTGGEYKSSVHRVVNKKPRDRYSVAFFFDGNLDCPLDPLDGSKPPTRDWTVEKHMMKRIMDSYGGKQ
ncbi:hypothetical protein QBC46DRAFT_265296 [Diplogelasinospora grovesii]|uniref:Fe2OG dioxygenase domain-containing protein n=1 Tax=Diplogelasinospora grovesii TaxID=303347 RepID=A0AAN6S292_9PEZI|nr:hypothetical protein QBC46DRAFT_265296 [Diplogelasinospora grovesii]